MPQDAFTLSYVARELDDMFTGGKISKINQPTKDELSLLIYTRFGTIKLIFNLSAKFCRISAGETGEYLNPQTAPNFCMLLRKHLQNAEVLRVRQVDFERVVYFDFRCFSEFETVEMRLYLEIMGKYSNAILTRDGQIVGALKTASLETGARRVTLSGARYVLPAKQDKINPKNFEELERAPSLGGARAIADGVCGIAYSTAQDIVDLYGENPTARQVYEYVNSEKCSPCVVYADGKPADFKARLTANAKPEKTILEAQAKFYDYATKEKQFTNEKRALCSAAGGAVKKTEKRLADIIEKLEECKSAERAKLFGELITANIYAVERGASELEAINYYDENAGKVKIPLDVRLTPAQNAQKYYKRYAKLKRTAVCLDKQREETEEKLNYLKSIECNLSLAETMRDLEGIREELCSLSLLPKPQPVKGQKQKKAETPFRTYSFLGYKIVCGRNNVQNDRLTKGLSPRDIWLHTKNYHSAHVGIIAQDGKVDERVLLFAAEICAYYSDARENGKAPVDYTLKKFVKKPAGAAAGFVIYTDFKTILAAPKAHAEERQDE